MGMSNAISHDVFLSSLCGYAPAFARALANAVLCASKRDPHRLFNWFS
jgi:hypothetical protein